MAGRKFAVIIPALNEAGSIATVCSLVPREIFCQVMVVDNGSTDGTLEAARHAGAEAVLEPRRGYGQACLTGLAHLRPDIEAVAFLDADLSDDPADVAHLAQFFEENRLDLAIGSRVLGEAEPGALTGLQRFGNWLSTWLIRTIWKVSFTDLGPLRIVSRPALERLNLQDRNFGWNVEMQAKAAALKLRTGDIPVRYRCRRSGSSKISGTVAGSLRAGVKILWTIYRCWRHPLRRPDLPQPSQF